MTSTIHSGAAVIHPTGRITMRNAPKLRDDLDALVADGINLVVVDLSEVDSVDSAGLGALIAGLKAARKSGGELRIAAPNAKVLMVLDMVKLSGVFYPYESTAAAMAGRAEVHSCL